MPSTEPEICQHRQDIGVYCSKLVVSASGKSFFASGKFVFASGKFVSASNESLFAINEMPFAARKMFHDRKKRAVKAP
jgi:hypothetical protein